MRELCGRLLPAWTSSQAPLNGAVFAAVVLVGLAFTTYTQHVWEDYWITFRASRNLATGQGLVFTPGERLHTFTSPLGVLLPAGLSWMTGNTSDALPLWLFRLVSIAAFGAGIVVLLRVMLRLLHHRIAVILTLALVALDAKTVDFTINGMEIGLLVFFLALTLHGLCVAGPGQVVRIGVGWAGLMWTRPDSCVYIGILTLGALIFLRGGDADRTRTSWSSTLVRAGLVSTVLYLPWFAWAWSYYGSPVPHTIVAKGTNAPALSLLDLVGRLTLFPFTLLGGNGYQTWVFMPAYAWFGGWHYALQAIDQTLARVAALAWSIPLLRPETRMLSLAFCLGLYFLGEVVRAAFPWYLPLVAVLGYLTIGLLFDELLGLARRLPRLGWDRGWFRRLPLVLRVSATVLIIGQALVTACVARQMQVQQALIETGLRRQIGLWLRANARAPSDTVFLEPLGYIGYFSQLKMLDYPGLSSKEVVAARRRLGPAKQNQVYLELKPDWLVLRPVEIQNGEIIDPAHLQELYDLVRVFNAKEAVDAASWVPGKNYLRFDQTFLVFRRKALAPAS